MPLTGRVQPLDDFEHMVERQAASETLEPSTLTSGEGNRHRLQLPRASGSLA